MALGLLIVYHIVISFQSWAKTLFFIQNDQLLEWLWIPMSALNVWRIPLLFMVSGMGACFAMERRDWLQFLTDRAARIAIPFAFGFFIICPIAAYFVMDYYDMGATYEPNAGHLWFLINIMCYVAYYTGLLWAMKEYGHNGLTRFMTNVLRRPWMIYVAAIPLMLEGWIVAPEYYAAFPTPHGHFVGAICFGLGILFVSLKDIFWGTVEAVKGRSLLMAFGLFLVRLFVFELEGVPHYMTAFESMAWMLGILGYCSVYLNRPSRWLSYFSKAVYPVYIVHFPIQYAISYYLMPTTLSAEVKLVILLVGTFTGCFVMYEIVRRIKWIRPLFGMKLTTSRVSSAQPY